MKIHITTTLALFAFVTSAAGQQHMREEKIPAKPGVPSITIMVPKDWKVVHSSTSDLALKDTDGRVATFTTLQRKKKEEEAIFRLCIDNLNEYKKRVPEIVKEWKQGTTSYAMHLFSSRITRAQRPNTFMEFTIWNQNYAVLGTRILPRVVDILEAQDWELIARSIKLK